jgi:hypothetical protein
VHPAIITLIKDIIKELIKTSERTFKKEGWSPQARPEEDDEIKAHRQLIVEIVYGLYYVKKQRLKEMGMPPQPISLSEIWAEFVSRRLSLSSTKEWRWKWHNKRYLDRRVNEAASPKYSENNTPKIIAAKAGLYEPNAPSFF